MWLAYFRVDYKTHLISPFLSVEWLFEYARDFIFLSRENQIHSYICSWKSSIQMCADDFHVWSAVFILYELTLLHAKRIFSHCFSHMMIILSRAGQSFHKLTSWHFHMWTKISKWKENHVLCVFLFVVWDPLKGLVSQRSISLFSSFDVLTPVFNLLPISVKTCTKTCFIPHDHTLKRVFVWCDSPTGVLVHKQLGATATQMQRVSTSPDTRLLNYPRRFNYAVLLL